MESKIVDLPDPVLPTIQIFSPGEIEMLILSKALCYFMYSAV